MRTQAKFSLARAMLALCLCAGAQAQTTIYVDDDAPGDPGPGDPLVSSATEDGSLTSPFDSIAEGVIAAQAGDVVLLRPGVYSGPGNAGVSISKDVTVRSEYGAASCKIDGGGSSHAFSIFLSDPTIRGITFENGSATTGGALRMQGGSAPTIAECVFRGNSASNGGAIYVENSAPEIRSCVFTSNSAGKGGGALYVRLGSAPEVINCSFTSNAALLGGALFAGDSSQTTVRNCVLWGDGGAGLGQEIYIGLNTGGVTVSVASSDVAGGASSVVIDSGATLDWGLGNIDVDPQFVVGSGGDVHLRPGSPCIDQGNSALADAGQSDVEGDSRVVGPAIDMGADEFFPRFYVTGDKSIGGMIALNVVGPGNATPVLLFTSTGLLPAPIPTAFGPWQLTLPTIPAFPAILGSLSASGSLALPAQIPPSASVGLDVYTQTIIGSTLSTPEILNIEP